MKRNPEINQFDSSSAAAVSASRFILAKLKKTLESKESVSLVLSGGSAPRQLNAALTEVLIGIDFGRIDWFFGDERAVEPDDPRSNYRMQMETLLNPLNIDSRRIHRIKGELGANRAASDYCLNLADYFAGPVVFDIIILGLGPDGHTASLFPGSPAIQVRDVPVTMTETAPLEPHVRRITLTLPTINSAKTVIFFTGRDGKETVIEQLLLREIDGSQSEQTHPFKSVKPGSAGATWFIYGSNT